MAPTLWFTERIALVADSDRGVADASETNDTGAAKRARKMAFIVL